MTAHKYWRRIGNHILILLALLAFLPLHAQEDLNVISGNNQWLHYTDARNVLYHHLAAEAYGLLEGRREKVASLTTPEAWRERQNHIRKVLLEIAGPFPERSPLNARVIRTIRKDFYRVEHIVFESQPKFFVTASLFLPTGTKKNAKMPAVIYCSGHSEEGYRSKVYQHVILNLVKKGFAVFAFDPVGQGERLEYYDAEKNKSAVGGPTSEHSYPGTQAFISGSSQAKHMIWDGIRAVDYLLTRKEIDPARLGITGRSGGGTQSAFIAAFDDRIYAAAPECYITSFTRLLQSIGPQDAEQNLFQGIRNGMDHGDLLLVRAPRPALMITTTRDMFSIQGARETAGEVERIYEAFGKGENFGMVEDDAPHASTKKNREAMYAFFRKHLGNPGSAADEEVELLTPDEIKVTGTGQVSTSFGGETIFTLNMEETRRSVTAAREGRHDMTGYLEKAVRQAGEMSGFRKPGENSVRVGIVPIANVPIANVPIAIGTVFTGRIQRDDYAIEKYFVKGEGDYVVPYLLMIPQTSNHKTLLYLDPAGKNAAAGEGGKAEKFVRLGFTVLLPDLPGIGELGAGAFKGDSFIGGISHNVWYTSLLVGRSIVGIQAGDLLRVLGSLKEVQPVYGVAARELAPLLLHAAVFSPTIERVALIEPLISWRSLTMTRFYHSPFISGAVPGQLKAYDLPDLIAALAPRKCILINPLAGGGEPVSEEDVDRDLSFPRDVYAQKDAAGSFSVERTSSPGSADALDGWMNAHP